MTQIYCVDCEEYYDEDALQHVNDVFYSENYGQYDASYDLCPYCSGSNWYSENEWHENGIEQQKGGK